jgi:hypothetical protein
MPAVTLDTLGRLAAHGHGLAGWCLYCSALYRPAAPATELVRAGFDEFIVATDAGPFT